MILEMTNNELAQYTREAKLISLRKQIKELERQIFCLGDNERYVLKEINTERQMLKSRISVLETHIKHIEEDKF